MNFKEWFKENKENIVYRYLHKDGKGLMNNNSLDYDRLSDKEYNDVELGYLRLQQPSNFLHSQKVIFAFSPFGEKKHKKLIKLLSKISKTGVVREPLSLSDYDVVWENNDGQLALRKKEIKSEMAGTGAIVGCKDVDNPNFQIWGAVSDLKCKKKLRKNKN